MSCRCLLPQEASESFSFLFLQPEFLLPEADLLLVQSLILFQRLDFVARWFFFSRILTKTLSSLCCSFFFFFCFFFFFFFFFSSFFFFFFCFFFLFFISSF